MCSRSMSVAVRSKILRRCTCFFLWIVLFYMLKLHVNISNMSISTFNSREFVEYTMARDDLSQWSNLLFVACSVAIFSRVEARPYIGRGNLIFERIRPGLTRCVNEIGGVWLGRLWRFGNGVGESVRGWKQYSDGSIALVCHSIDTEEVWILFSDILSSTHRFLLHIFSKKWQQIIALS